MYTAVKASSPCRLTRRRVAVVPGAINALAALTLFAVSGDLLAAPNAGERYQVAGRCVTLTRVTNGQAFYEWSEPGRSGSGNLPASSLGARCSTQPAAGGAPADGDDDENADADADAADMPQPATPPDNAAPVTRPTLPAAASGGDAAFRDDILRAHNQMRCMHGVPPLTWHPGVAAYAQEWVNRGGFNHSNSYNAAIGPMGENLYGSSGQPGGADAVSDWYSESRGYNYAGEGSGRSGHFTALIWKDAKYLGCARANGNIFCDYWGGSQTKDCSVPNMGGCYRQQVLPKVSDEAACR